MSTYVRYQPHPKKYATNAARQAAYRQRKAAQVKPAVDATKTGSQKRAVTSRPDP